VLNRFALEQVGKLRFPANRFALGEIRSPIGYNYVLGKAVTKLALRPWACLRYRHRTMKVNVEIEKIDETRRFGAKYTTDVLDVH